MIEEVTDEAVQQSDVRGFLRKMKRGEALSKEATSKLLNRIYNILEGLAGEGCYVDKPLDKKGLGWKIVIDGQHSDLEPQTRIPMPFELISAGDTWRVWLKDADVVLNNYHANRSSSLLLDGGGRYSAMTFPSGAYVYLYVYEVSQTSTKHGANCYEYMIGTSVPTNALASRMLGRVISDVSAVQDARGNQIFYTVANSDIISHDDANAVVHVNTSSVSDSITVDDHLSFVIRNGGVLKYYKVTDFLKICFEKFVELTREEPDPELDPSELLPIGEETYADWVERMKGLIRQCLIDDGWPYMPMIDEATLEMYPNAEYFGGWAYPNIAIGDYVPAWVPIEDFQEIHVPAKPNLQQALALLAEIKARLDEIQPDDSSSSSGDSSSSSSTPTLIEEYFEAINDCSGLFSEIQSQYQNLYDAQSQMGQTIGDLYTALGTEEQRLDAVTSRYEAIEQDVSDLEGGNQ